MIHALVIVPSVSLARYYSIGYALCLPTYPQFGQFIQIPFPALHVFSQRRCLSVSSCDDALSCNGDDNAPEPSREGARTDEYLDGAVPCSPVSTAKRGRFTRLQQDTGQDGPYNGGHPLEGSAARVGDVCVLGPAAGAVHRGVGPHRREAAAL